VPVQYFDEGPVQPDPEQADAQWPETLGSDFCGEFALGHGNFRLAVAFEVGDVMLEKLPTPETVLFFWSDVIDKLIECEISRRDGRRLTSEEATVYNTTLDTIAEYATRKLPPGPDSKPVTQS